LPGFRKGKVPFEEVRKRFGREVQGEVLEQVIGDAVREAVRQQELDLLGAPRVEDIDFAAGQPLRFKALVDVRPAIELGSYDGLKIDKVVRKVTDEDVEHVLQDLRLRRAELEEVDRPAEPDDVVTVNLGVLGPGRVPIVGTRQEGLRLLLSEQAVPEHWLQGLVGRRAGEKVAIEEPRLEGERQRPPGTVEPGGDRRYDELEVIKVEARRVPPLDDDFAREVARVESLADLRVRLRENLQEEEDRRATKQVERQILDRLAEPLKLEVPERLAKRVADELYETAMRQHPHLEEEARERLAVEAEKEARRRLRQELVVAEVGRREQIEVTQAEAEQAMAGLVKGGMELPDDAASRERMIDGLRDSIYERKVLKLLVDRADIQAIEQSGQAKRIVTPWDR